MLIWVLHGPNLNLLGTREPGIYGAATLADINQGLAEQASSAGAQLESFQSNHEGALVDRIQAARAAGVDFIVINPAAYTPTSLDGLFRQTPVDVGQRCRAVNTRFAGAQQIQIRSMQYPDEHCASLRGANFALN